MTREQIIDVLCAIGCLLIMAGMMWLSTQRTERELHKFDQTFQKRSNK